MDNFIFGLLVFWAIISFGITLHLWGRSKVSLITALTAWAIVVIVPAVSIKVMVGLLRVIL